MARKYILSLAIVLLAGMSTAQIKRMDLIISQENMTKCGHNYSSAAAWVWPLRTWRGTGLLFRIRGAKPNHLHTIWLKLAAPSPLTGAGATPAASVRGLPRIISHAGSTSAAGANAFYTNRSGNAWVWIPLRFRLSKGVYPFSAYDNKLSDVGIGNTPFTFRVISHCTDYMQHGLTPGVHEPTFQVSLK